MSGKKGLGKGLSALIPELEVGPRDRPTEVAISAIRPNPDQPRRGMDTAGLEDLASSIREHGVIQPLIVRRDGSGPGYQIVAGERRWRAAQRAGLDKVPVVVREIDDRRLLEIALVENLQREDLNPLDEALALQELLKLQDSQEAVGRTVGKSRPYVANAVRLLQLEPGVQDLVRKGTLSAGHGRTLLALEGMDQVTAAREVVASGLTVRQTEALVKRRLGRKGGAPARPGAFAAWEGRLQESLRANVRIVGSIRRGRIVIPYAGEEDLRRLLESLAGEEA